jgi:phage protein D
MSGRDLARRTAIEVKFDGIDISDSIQRYLTSITYTDNEEDETDDLQIDLQDRDGIWLTKWLSDAISAAAPKPGPTVPRPVLRNGSRGSDVRDMQELLAGHGFPLPRYGADGVFGGETERAVRDFQKARGLLVDGVCGPQTWGALEAAAGAKAGAGFLISARFVQMNWHGDGKDLALDCGQFELDAVGAKGPPSSISIRGTSLPYGTGLRQAKKSKVWKACCLSQIASKIAAEGGMRCMYEAFYDPWYERREQANESDIGLLSRLCHDAGISLKAGDNAIVLFDQAVYEAAPPVLDIVYGDGSYGKWNLGTGSTDTKYASCRVKYTSPATGRAIVGTAYAGGYGKGMEGSQRLEIAAKVGSIAEAEKLAAMRLRLANKNGLAAQFALPGNPGLAAGLTVALAGWGPWSGKYIISQAQHTVGKGGYTTQVKLRQVLEGY